MTAPTARRTKTKSRSGGLAWFGSFVRFFGRAMPGKPRNSLVALIEMPYVLVLVVTFLALVIPMLAFLVLWLVVRTIFLLPQAVMWTVASKTSTTAGTHVADSGGESVPDQPEPERDHQLALMSGGDPAGLQTEALDRAAALWQLWQHSIARSDSDLVRPAMNEGFWRVHRMLLEVRSNSGVERVCDARVVGAAIVGATHSGIVDELRVGLTCEGACYDHAAGSDLVLRGAVEPGRWREELTLRRSADVTRLAADGPVPTVCPNCGAPLDVSPDGACRTCQALVAGRPTDWVLVDAWREQW